MVWSEVSHWIRTAFQRTNSGSFENTQDNVLNGRALLWLALVDEKIEGAAVTQVALTDTSKVCEIVAIGGGGFRRWAHLLETIETYARGLGCDCTQALGRPGFARLLKNYKPKSVLFERQL